MPLDGRTGRETWLPVDVEGKDKRLGISFRTMTRSYIARKFLPASPSKQTESSNVVAKSGGGSRKSINAAFWGHVQVAVFLF